ncbi:unnamed protein product, partial [Brassica rapa subsp. narinosa]
VVADLICRGSGEWNITRIKASLPHLLPEIQRLQPSITGAADSYTWLASRTGDYSVKSGYFVATSMEQIEETLFPWILWGIWTARNYLIFENRVFDPSDIISKAVSNAREWNEAQQSLPSPPLVQSDRLPPSPANTFELQCFTDAAWNATINKAGCGWYIVNCENDVILQGTR